MNTLNACLRFDLHDALLLVDNMKSVVKHDRARNPCTG
jgi:hypothetical protein